MMPGAIKLKTKSFKTKIFLAFFGISLLPLLVVAASNIWNVIETRRQNVAEMQNLAISNATAETKKFLNQKITAIRTVVSGGADDQSNQYITNINNISQIGASNQFFLLTQVKNQLQDFEKISMVDKDGTIALSINKDGLMVKNNSLLNSSVNDESAQYAESLGSAVGGTPLFATAMSGEDYFGPVEYVGGSPTLEMASQIVNPDNEIIGVMAATIRLDTLKNIINSIQLGSSGFVYLVDAESRLIISSDEKFAIPGEKLIDPPLIADVVKGNSHDGRNKFETFANARGDKMVFAGRPLGMTDDVVKWSVLSEWPRADAFQVINRLLYQSLVIFLAVLAAIIILGLILARQITKPIKILSDGARAITEGRLDQQIALKTNDEFNELGSQFNQMIKVLKENKQLRDEFVFIAAHELRTPVTAIKGYLSMMLDGTFGQINTKMAESLQTVYNSNERLVQLVQDLLEIARSESGKMEIKMGTVDLAAATASVITELNPLAKKKNIKINYPAGGQLPVKADEYKLKELLINIIGNAIKYTLESGDINISHEATNDGMIITHIEDHGIGMSKEALEKLFGKFYRVKTDQTAKIEGTGLGLFICKEIVERMGGKIWVESVESQGSTFSFSLAKSLSDKSLS